MRKSWNRVSWVPATGVSPGHPCPAAVHDLQDDPSAFLMNRLDDAAPTFDLRLAVDARRPVVALPRRRRLRAFRDDQARGCALAVIFHHDVGRRIAWTSPVAGHGGHDDPVGERDFAKLDRRKEVAHVAFSCGRAVWEAVRPAA